VINEQSDTDPYASRARFLGQSAAPFLLERGIEHGQGDQRDVWRDGGHAPSARAHQLATVGPDATAQGRSGRVVIAFREITAMFAITPHSRRSFSSRSCRSRSSSLFGS
jgi:hypothetical protein